VEGSERRRGTSDGRGRQDRFRGENERARCGTGKNRARKALPKTERLSRSFRARKAAETPDRRTRTQRERESKGRHRRRD